MGNSQNHMKSRVLTSNKGMASLMSINNKDMVSMSLIKNRACMMRTHRGASERPTRQMAPKTPTQREKSMMSTLETSTGAKMPSCSQGSQMKIHTNKTSARSSTVATKDYMGTGCRRTTKIQATWAMMISFRRKIQEQENYSVPKSSRGTVALNIARRPHSMAEIQDRITGRMAHSMVEIKAQGTTKMLQSMVKIKARGTATLANRMVEITARGTAKMAHSMVEIKAQGMAEMDHNTEEIQALNMVTMDHKPMETRMAPSTEDRTLTRSNTVTMKREGCSVDSNRA